LSPQLAHESEILHGMLLPLPGERPTGSYLLYEGTYDRIREARRADSPDLPRDIWDHDLKVAEWVRVEDLCRDALSFRTKDLQIAAWWLEAALHVRGFQGLSEGIELLHSLCDRFWEDLYPALSEDLDYRIAPFHWLNEKLAPQLMMTPLTGGEGMDSGSGITWGDWKQAVWLEVLKARNPNDADVQRQVDRAKSKEDILRALKGTSREPLLGALEAMQRGLDQIRELEFLLDDRLEKASPSLIRLRENLSEIHGGLSTLLKSIPGALPSPTMSSLPDSQPSGPDTETPSVASHDGAEESRSVLGGGVPLSPSAFTGRESAYRSVEATARYLLSIEPHSPAPYLMLRAVAWGNKPLAELIVELRRNGLDLESLSSLLGLNEEGDM
jgi:type VI secretion system protein ImpA